MLNTLEGRGGIDLHAILLEIAAPNPLNTEASFQGAALCATTFQILNMKTDAKKYIEQIRAAVKETGRYNLADEMIIEHAALTLAHIEQAKKQVDRMGMIQVFKTEARQIAPEINNLRGLMADFRKYCDDLGLSPAARNRLDIQIKEKKTSSLRSLRPAKVVNE